MPRQPTGNPRGRPVGTGQLDAPKRITVWLPGDVYEKLTIYAEGRRGTRGGHPQLARTVRDAITHYLFCPEKRQPRPTGAPPSAAMDGQTSLELQPPAEPKSAGKTKAPGKAVKRKQIIV